MTKTFISVSLEANLLVYYASFNSVQHFYVYTETIQCQTSNTSMIA